MSELKIYENKSHAADISLLEADKLSYAVLVSVLQNPVKKVVTDGSRIIIAHTAAVFPTWIWAPEDVTREELETIYQTIKREFVPLSEYRFNTKYAIAEWLTDKFLQEDNIKLQSRQNIAAYECRIPQKPKKQVPGALEQMKPEDTELAARMIREASVAIGDRIFNEEESVEAAKEQLQRQCLYLWRDEAGNPVAFCDRNEDHNYTKVSQVYTVPEARGQGYAGEMIYEICRDIVAKEQIPMLYADADYLPSNRCYQNIGFKQRGRIVTIGVEK